MAEDPGRKWYNKLFSVVPKGQETASQEPLPPLFGSAVPVESGSEQDSTKTVEMTLDSPPKVETAPVVVTKQVEEVKSETPAKPTLPVWKPVAEMEAEARASVSGAKRRPALPPVTAVSVHEPVKRSATNRPATTDKYMFNTQTEALNLSPSDDVYRAADIAVPTHGFTILKVADMLQSEHIRHMAPEVKRSSIMVALEASSVRLQDIIEDAVRRSRALDNYERLQQKAMDELESRITQENERIQSEIDKLVQERQAQIASNNDELSKQRARYYNWQLKKKQDEQKIKDAIGYFVNTGAPKPPSRTTTTAQLQETLESEASAGGQ